MTKSKKSTKRVTAKDVPGTGMARKAADAIAKRKKSKQSQLDAIMGGITAGRKKTKPKAKPKAKKKSR